MNQELYYGLVRFLATGKIPTTVEEMIKEEVKKIQKNYQYQKPSLYYIGGRNQTEPRQVIPHHQKNQLLKQTHDHPLSGHQGQDNTHQRTSTLYYWPGMEHDIREYVKTCHVCQKRNRK